MLHSVEPSYIAYGNNSASVSLPTTSRRYLLPGSLNTSSHTISSSKKSFIPFVQERDHLGRLLKDGPDDIQSVKSKAIPLKLSLLTPMDMKRIYETSSVRGENKLPAISKNFSRDSTKSLYKLVENSFDGTGEDVKLTQRNEIDKDKLLEHLFKIKVEENKSLQVEPPTTRHFKALSVANKSTVRTEADYSRRADLSIHTEEPLKKTKSMAKLNTLNIVHTRNASMVDSAYGTTKSMETVKDMVSETDSPLKDDCSLYNPTVFRYDATHEAQNKEVASMINKNQERKKKNNHQFRLILPESNLNHVPPIGLYHPQSKSIRHRVQNAMILPEHETRLKLEKLRQIKIDELQREKMKQMSEKIKQQEEEHNRDDKYYRNLFKEMLQEINQRARGGVKKEKKPLKKFDYIMLEKFSHFPPEFEAKINEMRSRMRVVKERIASNRDSKDN